MTGDSQLIILSFLSVFSAVSAVKCLFEVCAKKQPPHVLGGGLRKNPLFQVGSCQAPERLGRASLDGFIGSFHKNYLSSTAEAYFTLVLYHYVSVLKSLALSNPRENSRVLGKSLQSRMLRMQEFLRR